VGGPIHVVSQGVVEHIPIAPQEALDSCSLEPMLPPEPPQASA